MVRIQLFRISFIQLDADSDQQNTRRMSDRQRPPLPCLSPLLHSSFTLSPLSSLFLSYLHSTPFIFSPIIHSFSSIQYCLVSSSLHFTLLYFTFHFLSFLHALSFWLKDILRGFEESSEEEKRRKEKKRQEQKESEKQSIVSLFSHRITHITT